jgi:signal transduction histidine kinase
VSALADWAVWRNARQAQAKAATLHERDLHTHEALATIRSSVYLIAILTRDYLLDQDPTHGREYIDQFNSVQASAKHSFDALDQAAQDEVQHSTLRLLWMELEGYWDTTQVMLDWSPKEKQAQRDAMLHQRIRRREEILALAERIEELTSQSSAEERGRMAAEDRDFQASLGFIAGGALLLGLGISVFTLIRMRGLEQKSHAAETGLRMLSGQIRTTQEEERKFLSRELHDQVGQILTGLRMELTAISRLQAAPDSEATTRLTRAKGTVEQILGIVRNIAMLLRPSMLDDLGLTPALNWLVKEVSRSRGMTIRAEVNPLVDELPDAHRTCLYRVVQEALTNATRHSGARTVDLQVDSTGDWVRAIITDDGKGFERGTEWRKGLGLLGMEERVRELGGNLRVVSAPGRGTSVEIRLPCPTLAEDKSDEDSDRGRSRDRSDRIKTSI